MSNAVLTLRSPASEEAIARQPLFVSLKRPADFLLAIFGLVLSFPVLVITALLVKLTSRGPMLYSQVRLGLNGRPFRIYKLRTMCKDSEVHTGPCWSTKGDPRVTWIGRILRRTHLDELPQLWNILIGDMSLIGPRPERPEMVPALENAIPRYRERLLVRPGLTGLAQVQLPPDTDLNSVRLKLAHDLCYVENLTFWLDVRLVVATACNLAGVPGGLTRFVFALPGGKAVEQRYGEVIEKTPVPELQPA